NAQDCGEQRQKAEVQPTQPQSRTAIGQPTQPSNRREIVARVKPAAATRTTASAARSRTRRRATASKPGGKPAGGWMTTGNRVGGFILTSAEPHLTGRGTPPSSRWSRCHCCRRGPDAQIRGGPSEEDAAPEPLPQVPFHRVGDGVV